jgi:hypothetical protein
LSSIQIWYSPYKRKPYQMFKNLSEGIFLIKEKKTFQLLGLVENIPIPGSKMLGKYLGLIMGKIGDEGLRKMLPGDYTLINLLIELVKGTIKMDHFNNTNFYLKIADRQMFEVNERPKEKVSEIREGSKFSLSYENYYDTELIEYNKRDLNPNSNMVNNDHCLEVFSKIQSKMISYKFLHKF